MWKYENEFIFGQDKFPATCASFFIDYRIWVANELVLKSKYRECLHFVSLKICEFVHFGILIGSCGARLFELPNLFIYTQGTFLLMRSIGIDVEPLRANFIFINSPMNYEWTDVKPWDRRISQNTQTHTHTDYSLWFCYRIWLWILHLFLSLKLCFISTKISTARNFSKSLLKSSVSFSFQMTFDYQYVDPGPDDPSSKVNRYFALNVSMASMDMSSS